jgi:hypothetical protein
MATEEQRKMAHMLGISVEELERRRNVGMSARQTETRQTGMGGGVVMCETSGDRVVRMNGSDVDAGGSSTADEMAAEAMGHLQKFRDNPKAANSHEHIARASAMCSAALARCARDNAERTSSMHTFRG